MTRINLIPPNELTDQHLLAEYRELPRIFGAVRKKLANNQPITVGDGYKMGTGHVIFFYDKLGFLEKRYQTLIDECLQRGFNIQFSDLDLSDIPPEYKKDYHPTPADIAISQQRIDEKLQAKPGLYRMYGKIVG